MSQLFNLEGKVAAITGAGGVLGGSMAEYLAAQGVKIAVLDLRQTEADTRAQQITDSGGKALALTGSVLEQADMEHALAQVMDTWGKVDILINCAGGNMTGATVTPSQTVFDLSIDAFRKVMDLNLFGSVVPIMVFGKQMARQGEGIILNISSMSVARAITRVAGYSAGKAAIENFTRWLAVEMAQKFGEGIRVNAIAPGFFVGDQNRKLLTEPDGSLTPRGQLIIQNTPMNRFGVAEELNGTVHWLCSQASQFITGITVPVDGGFSAFSGV